MALGKHSTLSGTWLAWGLLSLVLIVSLWLRGQYVWVPAFHWDEGHWLMFALLANAGYPAYSVTFVGIPPLALLLIQLGAKLFGTSLALRYPMMLVTLVGIGSIFWLFRPKKDLFGLIAGTFAALLLSFVPILFLESVSIMGEAPAVATALLSLVLAQQFYDKKRIFWLLLSGVAFACSLAIKVFVIFLPILISYFILLAVLTRCKSRAEMWRQLIVNGVVWGIGVIIPPVLFLLIYDPVAMYQQVIAFRFALREVSLAQGVTPFENVGLIKEMIAEHSYLVIGAALGALLGWRERRLDVYLWLLWLFLAVLLLFWQIPLRDRYVIMLLPGLAALTGIFIGWLITQLIYWDRRRETWLGKTVALALIILVVVWILITPIKSASLPPLADSSGYIFGYLTEELKDGIEYARANTTADDCLVADDQRFAMAAGRLVPPTLSETTNARLVTAWFLDTDAVVAAAINHDCPMTVIKNKTKSFWRLLPELPSKLRDLYFLEIHYDQELTIFAEKKDVTRQPDTSFQLGFEDNLELRGIDLTSTPWYRGQKVQLATYWTAHAVPSRGYKIFLQLRTDQGETVANYDHFPFPVPTYRYRFMPTIGGQYRITPNIDNLESLNPDVITSYPNKGMVPTNAWPAGNTIREVTTMELPADLSPGAYHLYIGLYDPDTLIRLPIQGDQGQSDEFLLATVEVVEPES
jgi:4-amino-4-deoxy-L-arabinose transferase-like glycosyltransferase